MSDPYQHYIDGEWVSGTGSETFESENPATGETLGTFERGTPEDVESAVDAADAAFEEWRELSRIQRAEYLWDVYHELRERTDELGEVVTKECGKEISEGKADVVEAAHMVEWAAGDARHPKGDIVPSEIPAKDAYMRRNPAASPGVSRRGTSRSRSPTGTWPSRWWWGTPSCSNPPSRPRGARRSSRRCSTTPASPTACSTWFRVRRRRQRHRRARRRQDRPFHRFRRGRPSHPRQARRRRRQARRL